jgi:hypothetical protein
VKLGRGVELTDATIAGLINMDAVGPISPEAHSKIVIGPKDASSAEAVAALHPGIG